MTEQHHRAVDRRINLRLMQSTMNTIFQVLRVKLQGKKPKAILIGTTQSQNIHVTWDLDPSENESIRTPGDTHGRRDSYEHQRVSSTHRYNRRPSKALPGGVWVSSGQQLRGVWVGCIPVSSSLDCPASLGELSWPKRSSRHTQSSENFRVETAGR